MPEDNFDQQISAILGRPYVTKNTLDLTDPRNAGRSLTIPEMMQNMREETLALTEALTFLKGDIDRLKARETSAEEKAQQIVASVGHKTPIPFQSSDNSGKKTLTERALEARRAAKS